ncbi:MAG: hypothetical protein ASARMPREDX12_006428 [Alectoria sarmentosa]|nr:MAG: hypothetical protein ASARMPREDX12_006428 [Alectoria sarmentosa]
MASLPSHSKFQLKSKPESPPQDPPGVPQSRLESLPDELLVQIVKDVDHEDIQAFARCCPKIWKVAAKAFEIHKRRQKYYTVRLGSLSGVSGTSIRPVDILRDLLTDDGLAIYPKRMVITTLRPGQASRRKVDPLDPLFLPEQEEKIRSLLQESRYFSDSWYDLIAKQKHPLFTTSLLLSLLPNLRAIELCDQERDMPYYSTTAHAVARASRLNWISTKQGTKKPGSRRAYDWGPKTSHALSNLTELCIYSSEGTHQDFGVISRWAWLPSLRSIRGKGLHSFKDRGRLVDPRVPSQQSDVTSLELDDCMVRGEDIKVLLESIKGLKTFKYHCGVPDTLEGSSRIAKLGEEQWNPRGVVEVLSTYASHSLVTLDLTTTGNPIFIHGDRLAGRIFVGSLRRFHLLRKLRADIMIFIESPLENLITKYAQIYREDSHEELVRRIKKTEKPSTDHVHLLVDLLPASLEELVLCSMHFDHGYEVDGLFRNALALKARRVPLLTKIVFEDIPRISQDMMETWKHMGVQMYWQIPLPVPEGA